jgi:hypothetical protein
MRRGWGRLRFKGRHCGGAGSLSAIDLHTLLNLVGALDDSDDPNAARLRFTTYLRDNIDSAAGL